jgi:phosphomannomutase/phosphoglucomutase
LRVNPLIFREYDIRGLAEQELTDETARQIGQAFGAYVQGRGSSQVLVGRDNRLSSARLRDALTSGLLAAGCQVGDIGLVITPMLYYSRIFFHTDGGVMITGSHNPPEENGFKLACGESTIYGNEILKLRDMITDGRFSAPQEHPGGDRREQSIVEPYLAMLREKITLGPRHLKVVVDCGDGTASLFAQAALSAWGCEVIPLYCESDGRFPHHHPDPVKTANLADLRQTVQQQGADLGIAFDGDADRIGVVDELGQVIWGDKLMCLYWREILERHPHALAIIEVKCSQALVDEVTRLGGTPLFYKTGHSLIKAKMRETDAVFTGEMSGHMFFADEYYGYDDAFYAAGRLLRILSHTTETLSELLAPIPKYYATAETRVPCADQVKFDVVGKLVNHFRHSYQVVDVDGARVLFEDGWGLVRASNTQPVLVARCESKTPAGLEQICSVMKQAMRQYPEVGDFDWER